MSSLDLPPPDRPILVVGAPRSGTTLLRVMLNRHPRIGLCDETYFVYWVADRERTFGDLAVAANRERVVARYLETDRFRQLGLDTDAVRALLLEHGTSYPELFRTLIRAYAAAQGKPRYGEKTPHHALAADRLLAWFPDAYLLHVVRDPRDVVASLLRVPWGPRDALSAAREWVRCVAGAHAVAASPRHLRVSYETLAQEPETELERVCTFVEEPFSDASLAASESREETSDRWWFDRAQGKVTASRIGVWQEKLTPAQIALVEHAAGPWMDTLGYARSVDPPAAGALAAAEVRATWNGVRDRVRRLPRVWTHWVAPSQLAREEYWTDKA